MLSASRFLRVPAQRCARRTCSDAPPNSGAAATALRWVKYALGVTVALYGSLIIAAYYEVKKVHTHRKYLTDEEVAECRITAQETIASKVGEFGRKEATDLGRKLLTKYNPEVVEREKSADPAVRKQKESEASEEAFVTMKALLMGDDAEKAHARAGHALFLVYTPEQLEIILKSPDVAARVLEGKLLTSAEIDQLKATQQDLPPPMDA
jgi:hypothetical protein